MQVSKVAFYTNINFAKNSRRNSVSSSSCCTSFVQKMRKPASIVIQEQREEEFFQAFLTKKGKVTKKEYEEIIKKHPSAIVKAQKLIEKEKPLYSSPSQIAKAALKLKERYDSEYNDNYIIASIGTSPALIAEVMQALGSKVVFIPASGLNLLEFNHLYPLRQQFPTIASRIDNVRHIADYSRKKGISNKSHNYLIMLDYCHSGVSLDNLCRIFEEENIFKKERIHDHSILGDLIEYSSLNDKNSTFALEDFANLSHDMQYSDLEKVSNVPHFYIYDDHNKIRQSSVFSDGKTQKELFKEFDEFSQPLARAFGLCAIHEAYKMI